MKINKIINKDKKPTKRDMIFKSMCEKQNICNKNSNNYITFFFLFKKRGSLKKK
jgi:hypothetical protein